MAASPQYGEHRAALWQDHRPEKSRRCPSMGEWQSQLIALINIVETGDVRHGSFSGRYAYTIGGQCGGGQCGLQFGSLHQQHLQTGSMSARHMPIGKVAALEPLSVESVVKFGIIMRNDKTYLALAVHLCSTRDIAQRSIHLIHASEKHAHVGQLRSVHIDRSIRRIAGCHFSFT